MTARNLPSGAVCLGCRLRLLSRATRPQRSLLSALDRRQRLRWFTTSPAPRSKDSNRPLSDEEFYAAFCDSSGPKIDEPIPLHNRPSHDKPMPLHDRPSHDKPMPLHDRPVYDEPMPFRSRPGHGKAMPLRSRPGHGKPMPLRNRPGHDDGNTGLRPRRQRDMSESEDVGSVSRRLKIDKNFWTKSRLLTETAASLGTDMLGKPAYAIVMKDRGLFKKTKLNSQPPDEGDESNEQKKQEEQDEQDEENDRDGSVDIEAMLEKQRVPATKDEVIANIEGLRPESAQALPHTTFHRIQDALEEGFLVTQLQDYIKQYKRPVEPNRKVEAKPEPQEPTKAEDTKEDDEAEEADPEEYGADDAITDVQMAAKGAVRRAEYPWIRGITPWVRLNSQDVTSGGLAEDANRHLHGYVAEADSNKTKLAVRIMRECWGLQIEELMNGVGEVEVTVDKREFSLLMRGNQRFLRYVSNRCLDQGESLEAFRNRNTLRIVATRAKTETVLSQLDETMKNITVRHIPTAILVEPVDWIDPDLLEEVGRLTNTRVKQTANKQRIQVTWIETKSRETALYDVEDMRHAVHRLLSVALRPSNVLSKLWGAELTMHEGQGRYLIDYANKQKWAWKDRLGTWARFVSPLGSGIASEATPVEADDSKEPLEDLSWKEPFAKVWDEETPDSRDEKELGIHDEKEPEPLEQNVEGFEEEDFEAYGEEGEEGEDFHYPEQEIPDQQVDLHRLLEMPVERQAPMAEAPRGESGLPLPDVIPIIEAGDISPAEMSEMEIQQRGGDYPYQPVRWSPELTTTTTAYFGHVLQAAMDAPEYSYLQEHGHNCTHPRLFSAVAPHPLQLASLGLGGEPSDFEVSSSILIRFKPSVSPNPAEPMVPAPPLELRLNLSNDDVPRLAGVHSFRALVDTHVHDIMLPAQPVDLRVVQTSSGHLQGRPQDLLDWQPVWDFLHRARLELADNKLEMPHSQKFQVPPRLFAVGHEPPSEALDHVKAPPGRRARKARQIARLLNSKIPEDPNENVSVLYDFLGLEIHRSVRVPHGDFDLTYTSVEAGQGGGRRAELSLSPVARPGAPNGQADETGQDLQRSFFEACYTLAAGPLFQPQQ